MTNAAAETTIKFSSGGTLTLTLALVADIFRISAGDLAFIGEINRRLREYEAAHGDAGGGTSFTVSTDARGAFELYQTMTVIDLESLLAAHEADMAEAASPESIAFGGGRIALIRAVLKAKTESEATKTPSRSSTEGAAT
jgi:hypothetical protein